MEEACKRIIKNCTMFGFRILTVPLHPCRSISNGRRLAVIGFDVNGSGSSGSAFLVD